MYPEIFHINFHNFLGLHNITIYTYAVFIATGTVIAAYYAKWNAKKELDIKLSNNLVYLIFIAGYIGGKLFFYLENPLYYINNPSAILDTFPRALFFMVHL